LEASLDPIAIAFALSATAPENPPFIAPMAIDPAPVAAAPGDATAVPLPRAIAEAPVLEVEKVPRATELAIEAIDPRPIAIASDAEAAAPGTLIAPDPMARAPKAEALAPAVPTSLLAPIAIVPILLAAGEEVAFTPDPMAIALPKSPAVAYDPIAIHSLELASDITPRAIALEADADDPSPIAMA
jgi:hypothetical protein